MDDEFKLCWKNFQDNIASGFQSLYDRGDLVDVTLACDGKLLQAHKIVLAICSPYFQEIFISNPCKHPIIILKDVSYNIMCELLEFMYQGVVNVKHTELQAFMKIGQLLQIKGLATNSSSSAASTSSEKSSTNNNLSSVVQNEVTPATKSLSSSAVERAANEDSSNICGGGEKPLECNSNSNTPQRPQSPFLSPTVSPMNNSLNSMSTSQGNKLGDALSLQQTSNHGSSGSVTGVKRQSEYNSDSLSIYSRNKHRRSVTSTDQNSEHTEEPDGGSISGPIDQINAEDFFLPHISMVESRYELNNIKRENSEHHQNTGASTAAAVAAASASLRNSFNSAAFGLDYSFYKNSSTASQSGQEYPNDLHMSNEYSKSFANHMDIPPNCPNVVMLSSTSLLHGHCVFNRNNTVATQQGMKTYWLCKSYRISMCRARCITHQGKIISATGVHNHPPHMRGNSTSGSNSGSNGGSNTGIVGGSNSNNAGSLSSSNIGSSSGVLSAPSNVSGSLSLRYHHSNCQSGSVNEQHFNEHHHSAAILPPAPSNFATNPQIHSSNTSSSNVVSTPHLYLQSMPNLLVQHYPNSPSSQLTQQPTFPPQHHNILHNYEMSSAMQQTSPSNDNSRNLNSSFDPHRKTIDTFNKDRLSDDHIPIHNAAALSPSGRHNTGIKGGHVESLPHNEVGKEISTSEHHQVQVIDSITISPGSGHNFKMESI